ncbi:hypothetical protein BDV10DRAFT_183930 [Aspergillus recurvatus]
MFEVSFIVVMTIVWLWAVSAALKPFLCRSLAYSWVMSIDAECSGRNVTDVAAGTLSLVTDQMVIAMALPHIWKLKPNLAETGSDLRLHGSCCKSAALHVFFALA